MTVPPVDERALHSYLVERSSSRPPEVLLEAALARVERTRQRAGWLVLDHWVLPRTQSGLHAIAYRLALVIFVLLLALLSAALIVTVGSRPHLPRTFGPAGNGLIAFDMNGAIFVARPDGSGTQPITTGSAIYTSPAWSLDGTRIAYFQRAEGAPASLIVAAPDGSGALDVTAALPATAPITSHPAAWSPDGRFLSFAALTPGSPDGDPHLVVVGADGTHPARVGPATLNVQDPTWSPDGTRIAFRGDERPTAPIQGAAVPPVGIYVMDAGGSSVRRITMTGVGAFGDPLAFANPQWSPDGTQILFYAGSNLAHDIYVVNVDGTGERALTNDPADEFWPTWSPDGRRIAFERTSDAVVMNADGTDQRILASDAVAPFPPIWAPDGTHIVVYTAPINRLEVLDLDGGPPTVLPTAGNATGYGSWQRTALP